MAPTRTCVGCRRARGVDELVRVVQREDGELALDRTGPGRGAWLCRGSLPCLERAMRRRGFGRAFTRPVEADQVRRLHAQLVELWGCPAPDVRG